MLIVAASAVLFFLMSLSTTLSMFATPLLYIRGDVCKYWKDSSDYTLGEITWWQRACLIERDWETMDYRCENKLNMGNWPVCFDQPYSPVNKGKPCIVYSFGIANDFRFDDAMAKQNCSVYSFDPSMGAPDHLRGDRVHFYNMGIGAEDNDDFIPRLDGYTDQSSRWKIKKLSSIMKMLGHSIDSVSLIKMDVEVNEWAILEGLLKEGLLHRLPQLLMEWHLFDDSPPRSHYKKIHQDYMSFQKLGFQKFWMRNEGRNHWLPKLRTQAETAYININYKKS